MVLQTVNCLTSRTLLWVHYLPPPLSVCFASSLLDQAVLGMPHLLPAYLELMEESELRTKHMNRLIILSSLPLNL